jgi:response regulator RpfG family c-di-GMP phosphodiesterase
MLKKKDKSVVAMYEQHTAIIVALISMVIVSVFILLFINLYSNNQEGILVNTLGKQRMLTQIMAKDANEIYELNSTIDDFRYNNYKEKLDLENKLSYTLKDLEQKRKEYESQYNDVSKGYVYANSKMVSFKNALDNLNGILREHNKLWPNFYNSISVVLREKHNTTKLVNAINYINANNETLLEYNDYITNIVLSYNNHKASSLFHLTILITICVLIILTIFFIDAYKNLFMPINQLYKGMEQVGITSVDTIVSKRENKEIEPVYSEINTVFNKLNSLISLIENLNKNVPFKDIVQYIFDSFIEYIPYTYIGIALISNDRKIINASYGISSKYHKNLAKRLLGLSVSIDSTSLGKVIESGRERIINDLEEYVKDKPSKRYNQILLEEGIRSSITLPLKNDKEVVGIIFFSSDTKNIYKKEHCKFLRTLANSIMLSLEEHILIDDMIISSTLALAVLTEERDPETGDHLNRMKTYSKIIAKVLSYEKRYKDIIDIDYINNIERFSPLHDIGKVAIRDEILLKPGKLTEEEFKIMKTHAEYGAKVLRMADENIKKRGRSIFEMGIEIAESHHEKWDGTGYPYGKTAEQIPLSARIVAIADVLDALTSERTYKKPFSFEKSVSIIAEGAGKHFDPHIVNVFLKNIDKIEKIYYKFRTGKNGVSTKVS